MEKITVFVILQTKQLTKKEQSLLANFYSKEIGKFNDNKIVIVPTTNPPPVPAVGPLVPGDCKGLTFGVYSLEDANTFVKHIQQSGLVEDFWLEQSI